MKTIKVKVTKADIEKGHPDDSERCPIALAIRRMGFSTCEITNATVWLDGMWNGQELPLSHSAQTFIDKYDIGQPVRPMTFTLKIP